MFARKAVFSAHGRAVAMATVAAVALTVAEPSLALAGPAPSGKGLSAATATSDATDFSARRRYYRGGGAAAAAAFAGIIGTGLAIAAAQNRPAYYYGDSYGYYGGGPVYYGGGPVYYGGGPYYYGGYGYGGVPYYRGHPLVSQLVTANLRNQLIRRSLWLADFCLLALTVNTLATGLD